MYCQHIGQYAYYIILLHGSDAAIIYSVLYKSLLLAKQGSKITNACVLAARNGVAKQVMFNQANQQVQFYFLSLAFVLYYFES